MGWMNVWLFKISQYHIILDLAQYATILHIYHWLDSRYFSYLSMTASTSLSLQKFFFHDPSFLIHFEWAFPCPLNADLLAKHRSILTFIWKIGSCLTMLCWTLLQSLMTIESADSVVNDGSPLCHWYGRQGCVCKWPSYLNDFEQNWHLNGNWFAWKASKCDPVSLY